MEEERIARAREHRERLLSENSSPQLTPAEHGGEMTQAERDRLEEERIAQARARREALLSGRAGQNDVRPVYIFFVSPRKYAMKLFIAGGGAFTSGTRSPRRRAYSARTRRAYAAPLLADHSFATISFTELFAAVYGKYIRARSAGHCFRASVLSDLLEYLILRF